MLPKDGENVPSRSKPPLELSFARTYKKEERKKKKKVLFLRGGRGGGETFQTGSGSGSSSDPLFPKF